MDKRTFKAKCLKDTKLHSMGETYKVITYVKPKSFVYVYDKDEYSYKAYKSFDKFLEKFEIV